MVLRGSRIRPESTLDDAQDAVRRARQYLKQTRSELASARSSAPFREALGALERRESHGEKVDVDELRDIVRLLVARIDALEDAERKGLEQVAAAERQVRETLLQLACGGAAGATARTFVAPIDRVKILMQTQHVTAGTGSGDGGRGRAVPQYHSLAQSLRKIVTEEGVLRLWRGNGVNCLRVVPYSGMQFATYDKLKSWFLERGSPRRTTGGGVDAAGLSPFGVRERLACGAGAAIVATCMTYPLDMIRLRLSVQPELRGALDSARSVLADGGPRAFFKGFVPTVCSITPFVAINFAMFDTFKTTTFTARPDLKESIPVTLGLGASAGLFAQTCCYPLDLVRRRMQLKGHVYNGVVDAFRTILRDEGPRGFYKGMLPNAVKVVPNAAVRFLAYDTLKRALGIEGRRKR